MKRPSLKLITACCLLVQVSAWGNNPAPRFARQAHLESSPAALQDEAVRTASSFQVLRHFNPWINSEHVQTIRGFFLRSANAAFLPRGWPFQAISRILKSFASTFESLSILQAKAVKTASSFQVQENFDPWIDNEHVQTIGGFFLRNTDAAYLPRGRPFEAISRIVKSFASTLKPNPVESNFWDTREKIETPDGDWFHADTKFASKDRVPSWSRVILIHGLESSSNSSLTQQMAAAFVDSGMDAVCLNFRSCSIDEDGNLMPNRRVGAYHLGFTDDLFHFLELSRRQDPKTRIYLSGFSLGANVVLKALGEMGVRASRDYGVQGAAVACAPFEQEANSRALGRPGINKLVYSNSLLKNLQQKAQQQLEQFFDNDPRKATFDFNRAMSAKLIPEFDDAFIAPLYNFEDCWDYYRSTSCIYFLDRITVPTLVVNAANDPFFDPSVAPYDRTYQGGGTAPVQIHRTRSGGHLGFCFQQVEETDPRLSSETVRRSWLPLQLSRFVQHVESASA